MTLESPLRPTQLSVNFGEIEVFRIKIIADPLKTALVLRMIRITQYVEKLSKAVWASAVFGRTCPFSRNANRLAGILAQKNLFQQNIMLPTIPEIVFVCQSVTWGGKYTAQPRLVFCSHSGRKTESQAGVSETSVHESMKMRISPTHGLLQGPMELAQRDIRRN